MRFSLILVIVSLGEFKMETRSINERVRVNNKNT